VQFTLRGDEPFLRGHFPGRTAAARRAAGPGGGATGRHRGPERSRHTPLPGLKLTAIRAAKILGTARPEETVTLHARITARMGKLISAQATATLRGTLILQCEVTLAGAAG
jgi:3-hydroxyacyl-[acyl-carrier-protein] dehydratase